MSRIRIGVIGTGTIIRDYHMLTLQGNPRVEVVAVANLRGDSAQALAGQYGIPKVYTDFDRMATDPEVEAVVIGLPNYLHAPVTIQMLEAGKHVLCEKPMALTAAECKRMIAAACQADRRLMIAHMWRFDHEIRWLHDVVESGVLGHVFKAKSHAIALHTGPSTHSWFVQREYAGGGALADMGVHAVDTLRFVLGEPRPLRVFATQGAFLRPIGVDDTADLMLEFEGGVTALIESGWYQLYADGLEAYSQVFGTQGYARALPSELHTHVGGVWSVTRAQMPVRQQHCDLPMYQRQTEHFLDCVQTGREPVPGGREGLWAMRVVEAAYRSAEIGQAVDIVDD